MVTKILLKGLCDSLYFPGINRILFQDNEIVFLIRKFLIQNIIVMLSIIFLSGIVPNLIINLYSNFNINVYNSTFFYFWLIPLYVFSIINNLNFFNKVINLYSERVEIKSSSFVYKLSNLLFFQIMFLISTVFLELIIYIPYIGNILYCFLYVMLYSYYCYDFRCCVYDINYIDRIKYFENNWIYFCGYGTPFLILKLLFNNNYHFLLRDILMFYLIIRSIFINYPKKFQDNYNNFSLKKIHSLTDFLIVFIFNYFRE